MEIVNTKTFSKLNEAVGVVGLHGLDTLYAFMIKNQLQTIQQILKTNQDKLVTGHLEAIDLTQLPKEVEQIIVKGNRTFQLLTDVVVLIGTLQIIRKHISYQLNTSCKFDSAHLESSLRTMNE